ncbi:hypothetical protein KKB83_00840 [Patescibacteria group bacterium]|nr:hypothetical protein [Patescibacteria group bacterium]
MQAFSWFLTIKLSLFSAWQFLSLVRNRTLHLKFDRIGTAYNIKDRGSYQILRESINYLELDEEPVVLIVAFRMKFLGNSSFLHRLFLSLSILTTPVWSGFPGFHTKLWMVDPKTNNYLGAYQWYGEENAKVYQGFLLRLLNTLAVTNSISIDRHPKTDLEDFLKSCSQSSLSSPSTLLV